MKWLTAALRVPLVRRALIAGSGVLVGLATEQVARLAVLPPEAVAALRALSHALSGS